MIGLHLGLWPVDPYLEFWELFKTGTPIVIQEEEFLIDLEQGGDKTSVLVCEDVGA